jgi:hypothetical protein
MYEFWFLKMIPATAGLMPFTPGSHAIANTMPCRQNRKKLQEDGSSTANSLQCDRETRQIFRQIAGYG